MRTALTLCAVSLYTLLCAAEGVQLPISGWVAAVVTSADPASQRTPNTALLGAYLVGRGSTAAQVVKCDLSGGTCGATVALGNNEVVIEKEGGFAFYNVNRTWGYFATAQDTTSSQLQLSSVELGFASGVQATMTIPRLTTYPNLGRASQGAFHATLPLVSFLGTTLGRIVAVTYAASTGSDRRRLA